MADDLTIERAPGVDLIPSPVPQAELLPALVAVEHQQMDELGTTGLRGAEPYNGWLYEEFLTQLRGMQGARVFREMADNDPMCGAVLYALEALVKNVDWRVEPADKSAEAEFWAKRVEAMFFSDMAHPFGQLIDEAASMFIYGYSPHEIIWKVCRGERDDDLTTSEFTDGLVVPAALPVRSQDTIWRWFFDTKGRGTVTGYEQMRLGRTNAVIPMGKSLLFRTQSRRENPEGRSILRSAYVPWMRKKSIEDAEGRLAMRSAGIVTVRIPAKFMDPSAGAAERKVYAAYKAIADTMAQDRQGSVVLPSDKDDKGNYAYDLAFTVADSRNVKDFTPIVDRYDARIAVSMLADFLLLGTKNVGSYALADSKTSLFVLSTEGYNAIIAEQLNRVLLRRVWKLNALDPKYMPKLKPGAVQKPDLERIGTFLQQCAAAGAPIFPSPDGKLEQWLLAQTGAPNTLEEG